jgi:hypothetical protein
MEHNAQTTKVHKSLIHSTTKKREAPRRDKHTKGLEMARDDKQVEISPHIRSLLPRAHMYTITLKPFSYQKILSISESALSITGEVGSSWSRRTAQRLLLLLAMLLLHLLSLEVALAVVGAFHWERGLEYVAAMNNWAECACAALSGAWTQFESRSFE